MYYPGLRFRVLCILFLFLFPVPLTAQAEQHAFRLAQNTSEPYHSVAACREYCRELVETQEPLND